MIPGGDKIQLINLNSLNDRREILESIPYTILKMLRRPENGKKKSKLVPKFSRCIETKEECTRKK